MSLVRTIALCATLATIAACTSQADRSGGTAEEYETALRGTVEIHVDEEILPLLLPAKELYDEAHPDAHVTLVPRAALELADDMIEHRIRGAVIARNWLPAEDTAVREDRGGEGFPTTMIARDALVFYAAIDFPLDTLNADDIKTWMAGGTVASEVYPQLKRRPTFVVPGIGSSVYGNVINQITGGVQPAKFVMAALPHRDSVKQAVLSDPALIGVGYLSQFVRDSSVKMLRLSYTDSSGTYIRPKPVHASYLIMGKYPFPVPVNVILKDRASQYSLPSGFALFMARDGKAQRTFFDLGIEPGYAHIELTLPE